MGSKISIFQNLFQKKPQEQEKVTIKVEGYADDASQLHVPKDWPKEGLIQEWIEPVYVSDEEKKFVTPQEVVNRPFSRCMLRRGLINQNGTCLSSELQQASKPCVEYFMSVTGLPTRYGFTDADHKFHGATRHGWVFGSAQIKLFHMRVEAKKNLAAFINWDINKEEEDNKEEKEDNKKEQDKKKDNSEKYILIEPRLVPLDGKDQGRVTSWDVTMDKFGEIGLHNCGRSCFDCRTRNRHTTNGSLHESGRVISYGYQQDDDYSGIQPRFRMWYVNDKKRQLEGIDSFGRTYGDHPRRLVANYLAVHPTGPPPPNFVWTIKIEPVLGHFD